MAYTGDVRNGWYEGLGTLTFPSGVIYQGSFRKGEFHGEGSLIYPGKGSFTATWVRGKATNGRFTFEDGLEYSENDWDYLTKGSTKIHGDKYDTLPVIPPDTFDTGNGYYDPLTNQVFSYDGTTVLETPTEDERLFILSHYRQGLQHAP